MSDQDLQPPSGIFEGYMKKRKNIGALTLISDCNKRYFYLDLGTYILVYYKNRKKSGTPIQIPLRKIIAVKKEDDDTEAVISGKEWVYQFYLVTTARSYDLRAYSWNDREVWMRSLNRVLDYKKAILAKRGVSLENLEIDIDHPPYDEKYDLRPFDFGYWGKILPLDQIPTEQPSGPEVDNQEQNNEEQENSDAKEGEDNNDEEDKTEERGIEGEGEGRSGENMENETADQQVVKINWDEGSEKSYSDTHSERNASSQKSGDSDNQPFEAQPSQFVKKKKSKKKSKKSSKTTNQLPVRDPDQERIAQIQQMKNDNTIYTKKEEEKFDMVIEGNDSDFEQESSESDPVTPINKTDRPTTLERQISRSAHKPRKNDERMQRILPLAKSIERPTHGPHFEVDNNLLAKWENQYGGKEKRKFYEDKERYKNSWDGEDNKHESMNIVNHNHHHSNIQPKHDIEFDMNWDEEELLNATPQMDDKIQKQYSSANPSRVPIGGMPYADSKFNNGIHRKLSNKHSSLAKAGKTLLS